MVASVGQIIGITTGSFFAFLILFVLYLRVAMGVFKPTFDRWCRAFSRLRWGRVRVVQRLNGPQQVEQMSNVTHIPPASAGRASFDSALTGATLVSPPAPRHNLPPPSPRAREVTSDDYIRDLHIYAGTFALGYFV